jgi:alkaline phosphatase D
MADNKPNNLPRRQFLQGLAAAPIALALNPDSEKETQPELNRRISVLQTWADENSSLVVVLGKAGWTFKSALNSQLQVRVLLAQSLSGTTQVLYRLQISGLTSASYGQFAIYDSANKLLETRSLKGLALQSTSPNIAVASCANYRKLESQTQMYSRLQEQRPDLILFIGDIVYSNSKLSSVFGTPEDPSTALERYLETWHKVNLYQLDPLIPTMATWDDHDYGANNGDASHPFKAEMKTIFRTFYPLPESHPNLSYGPGVSFRLRAFGIDLYMMDSRTHYVKGQTEWGRQQETWFSQDYTQSSLPAWILNGMQFFKYFFTVESLEKNAEPSLQMLKNLLRQRKKPTALFSGDVHCSQVQEISPVVFGYKTYEITSSGIHCNSAGMAMRRPNDPGQIFYHGENNFLLVRPMSQNNFMDLEITCANENGAWPVSTRPLRVAV